MKTENNIYYTETDKSGQTVTRYKKTNDAQLLKKQCEDFNKQAQEGKVLCLTDLFCNAERVRKID